MRKNIFLILVAIHTIAFVKAQTIPVGSPVIESYLRRQQLLGKFDSSFSFNYRPINLSKNGLSIDTAVFNKYDYFKKLSNSKGDTQITLLPASLNLAFDSDHPDSRNDGAMIRSRGIQTLVSGGIYTEVGPLSIQIKPELVIAENRNYQGFPLWPRHYESTWQIRYIWFNRIDQPERYGTNTYTKLTPGQSSIRLNKWGLSLGISTENLWWGPAIRNSIMMSNNAEGFPHFTFNTQKPIKTQIGSFEWQFITGKLVGSGYKPPAHDVVIRGRILYSPKPDDWRYFQALSLSYAPKWIKGLSLGMTRWVQQYNENAKSTGSYFPVFQNLFRKNDREEFGFNLTQDQAFGIFGRWIWFDSNAEFYFELAKNDAPINFRDLLVDTDHSRALTVGVSKLFPTIKENEFWQFNFEWTQTSQTESRLLRNSLSWYIHSSVPHGYTNNGEVLGSALGPGGNAQYLEVSKVKGFDRVGGAIERFVHNNDFNMFAFSDNFSSATIKDFTRYWVDYSVHAFYEKRFDRFFLNASLFYTYSLNYQWEVLFDPNDPHAFPDTPGVDRNNWNLDIKLSYSLF
ncbi:capsule assembly Wzi family protein [Roseivirga thermotolerans]|uniref:capsule assembly Wzi family protein n=1 Tax=Roseivirga thermotolerans TaxID=1758176 RepID=UPI00273DE94D|nr:capsule assembly Wzi family protein [Roseivirga thermotolerans]